MLSGSYRMPIGQYKGYSLFRIISFHKDYARECIDDSTFQKAYPSIHQYFASSVPKGQDAEFHSDEPHSEFLGEKDVIALKKRRKSKSKSEE